MQEKQFKVGDRVETIKTIDGLIPQGSKGTVLYLTKEEVGVEFDEECNGHELQHCYDETGRIETNVNCKEGHGWWLCPESLRLIEEENEPSNPHYQTDIQPIEVMQANMTKEEFIGFLKGNIIKYVCRCGRKDAPAKEAAKIKQYSDWLVKALEGHKIDPKI